MVYIFYMVSQQLFMCLFHRWCQKVCTLHPDKVELPLCVPDENGELSNTQCPTAIIWPWDFFSTLWEQGHFTQWVADDKDNAAGRTKEYSEFCERLEDWFPRVGLQRHEYETCVPLFFHGDGVRIYKHQKMFVYSLSSTCRKAASTESKLVFLCVRENLLRKGETHDAIAHIIAYINDTLRTGCFPLKDYQGNQWRPGSLQQRRAGKTFCSGWTMTFSAWKGDWEAGQVVHKLPRYYRTKDICEHCLASYSDEFTFADFNSDANSQSLRFSHEEFMMLCGPDNKSQWVNVRGWTKDRNLEVS